MNDIKVFDALSSGTRRQILELLRGGGRSVNEITMRVPVSQPAVSQHLNVLLEGRLVRVQRQGNQRIYALNPDGLRYLRQYVESLWDEVLGAFKTAADTQATEV